MRTPSYKRLCLTSFSASSERGERFEFQQGSMYLTSPTRRGFLSVLDEHGNARVRVSASNFAFPQAAQ